MQPPITPMSLGDMHENGVLVARDVLKRHLRHEKIVIVDAYGDDLFVPSFGPRMRCERCGQRVGRCLGRLLNGQPSRPNTPRPG